MSQINELKNKIGQKTFIMVLLSSVTYGLYGLIWITDRYKIFNKIFGGKIISINYIIWIAACAGISSSFGAIGNINAAATGDFTMSSFASIIGMIGWALYILAAFKLSKGMSKYCAKEFKINLKFNKFYLVIFNIFYINYYINALEKIIEQIKTQQDMVSE